MNDPTLSPDDPKLTAYALGELSGDERAHVEAAVRDDPGLRALVEEIRATAAHLEAALAAEAADDIEVGEPRWADAPRENVNGYAVESKMRRHPPVHPVPAAVNGHAPVAAPADTTTGEIDRYARGRRGGGVLQFPQLYVILASAAAACFAVFVHLRDDELKTRQQAAETLARIAQRKRVGSIPISPAPAIVVSRAPVAPTVSADAGTTTAPATAEAIAPADDRVAASRIAGNDTPPAITATEAPPTPAPLPENKLALLEITKVEQMTAPATPAPTATIPFSPGRPLAPITGVATATIGARASLNPGSLPTPAATKSAEPPATTTPRVALAGPPGEPTFVAAEPVSAPGDDIVRLDAFEVSADRLGNFIGSGALMNLTTITRGIPEHQPLPRAPRGARFGRAREIAAFTADNEFVRTADSATSQFSVDVDTASYGLVRRILEQGERPPRDVVRLEELVNYFPYDYAAPQNDQAFAAALEVASAPWAPEHRLVRIGLKAREIALAQRGPANLVFLLDVSGSMGAARKLPLVRDSFAQLLTQLRPDDHIAIVTYAADARVALPSTPVARTKEILAALAALRPAGPSEGGAGLALAYRVAIANFAREGSNRVVFCTDGAFNPGALSERALVALIDEKTRSGIALTVLGFGGASEHSTLLERLVQKAGATYGYVDSRRDAERQLVENVSRSLATIARDVRVAVDFNPAKVLAYRLIGYENRPLRREDYSDETPVTGEVGAGQAITALYEIVPALPQDLADAAAAQSARVRYGASGAVSSRLEMPDGPKPPGNELLTVNVRYKNPNTFLGWPRTQEFALLDAGTAFADASADFRFAAAVAEFGMILRGSAHRGASSLRDVIGWANSAAGPARDPHGYRRDFIALARKAGALLR